MKQVIQNYKTGRVTLDEVPVPHCGRKCILVQNSHSLISIGTEKAIIELGKKSLLGKARARPDLMARVIEKAKNEGIFKTFSEAMGRLDTPTPLGYSSAGTVVETGIEAREFQPGDRVACIGQGFASHAEYVSVPYNLAVKIPANVTTEQAAFGMLGCIALHGIRCANLSFGATVAVIGLGLLGQLTIQILKAYGCTVMAFDIDPHKITLAKKNGAVVASDDATIFENNIEMHTKGYGVDAVIVTAATTSHEPVDFAVRLCRQKGKIVVVGVADIHPNRNELWLKEIELVVSKAAGPGSLDAHYEREGVDYPIDIARWTERRNLEEFIRLIDNKAIDVSALITGKFPIAEAESVYGDFLNCKIANPIGMLFFYPNSSDISRTISIAPTQAALHKIRVGVIGAGLYGKAVFLPVLKKMKNIILQTLVTNSGVSANHAAKRFGFSNCTTDMNTILNDDSINVLIGLMPHNQHASFILQAIAKKKAILIEKPLCIHEEELEKISQAYYDSSDKPVVMIGHNRRYSPHAEKMRGWLMDRAKPAVMNYRINAGKIPSDHWVHSDAQGRGRIVGEMTHFLDLMQYLLNEKITAISAKRIGGDDHAIVNNDNLVAIIQFDRGSVASLIYASEGNRALSREYLEIFCDGKTILSKNFRRSQLMAGRKSEKFKTFSQSMGHVEEVKHFINCVLGEASPPPFETECWTMKMAFALEKSLVSR